ncbi:MAG: hypothetical protein HYV16_11935 [Gammaproteobacteria bacterium]|nr:hypothetical protein [Gammaproteobacteria bacterium]
MNTFIKLATASALLAPLIAAIANPSISKIEYIDYSDPSRYQNIDIGKYNALIIDSNDYYARIVGEYCEENPKTPTGCADWKTKPEDMKVAKISPTPFHAIFIVVTIQDGADSYKKSFSYINNGNEGDVVGLFWTDESVNWLDYYYSDDMFPSKKGGFYDLSPEDQIRVAQLLNKRFHARGKDKFVDGKILNPKNLNNMIDRLWRRGHPYQETEDLGKPLVLAKYGNSASSEPLRVPVQAQATTTLTSETPATAPQPTPATRR